MATVVDRSGNQPIGPGQTDQKLSSVNRTVAVVHGTATPAYVGELVTDVAADVVVPHVPAAALVFNLLGCQDVLEGELVIDPFADALLEYVLVESRQDGCVYALTCHCVLSLPVRPRPHQTGPFSWPL